MKLTKIFTALAVTLLAANANAGVVGMDTVQSDVPDGVGCDGCIANDITINFDGNVRGQQLWLNLTEGSIHNITAIGTETPSSEEIIGFVPARAWDTFVSMGGTTADSSLGVLIAGNAVDIPGAPRTGPIGVGPDDVGATSISVAWAPATTAPDVPSGDNYVVGRITLSPDANGDAWFFSSTSGSANDAPLLTQRRVIDGVLVPEPASMALAGFALLGLVASRRRS